MQRTGPSRRSNEVDDHSLSIDDDDNASCDDDFCTAEQEEEDASGEVIVAKSETVAVNRLRLVVFMVLVTSAVGAALSAYFYLSGSEIQAFRKAFGDDSRKILDALGSSLDKALGSLDGVAVTYVSYARSTNQTWPYVTLPDFALRMSKVLPISEAVTLNILPLVKKAQRVEWESYSVEHDYWVDESMRLQATWKNYYGPVVFGGEPNSVLQGDFGEIPRNESQDVFLPIWQNFPVLANTTYTYNFEWLSISEPEPLYECLRTHRAVMSAPFMIPVPGDLEAEAETEAWALFFEDFIGPDEEAKEPMVDLFYPIIDDTSRINVLGVEGYEPHPARGAVALIAAQLYWRALIRNILPDDSNGIRIVFSSACGGNFTYKVMGPSVEYLGVGDHHEAKFSDMRETVQLHKLGQYSSTDSTYSGAKLSDEFCPLTLDLYPSYEMRSRFTTINPLLFTAGTVAIFALTSLIFNYYNTKVEARQRTVLKTAVDSSAIVSSLFPATVRDRLYPAASVDACGTNGPRKSRTAALPSYIRGAELSPLVPTDAGPINPTQSNSPIAELYPDTTVMFADIVGFTSWSSTRQPHQVFHLLETLYGAFDAIAKQRGVFKVETIGDCYVAVVGLPKPKKHHAIVMARFARDCLGKMKALTAELEKTMGPGTADLAMRIGLNSGPTTAGVLRGEKSRFQLFGDTVNTAARMESNGEPNRIQVSQKTAELIRLGGKEHWLTQRDEMVDCKGKGKMVSYWVEPRGSGGSNMSHSDPSCSDADQSDSHPNCDFTTDPNNRLIDWHVDVFLGLLKDVVSSRQIKEAYQVAPRSFGLPMDEVKEVVEWSAPNKLRRADPKAAISSVVTSQLRAFIKVIADMYQSNPFHNFHHCCHVVMSTKKLLDRIEKQEKRDSNGSSTFTPFDPLSTFAIVFAALIHDVDHRGVSNQLLVDEGSSLATMYTGKSVAEQNSIDVAFNVLWEPWFSELRGCLFSSERDVRHFRQVVVNAVMATDLFDNDLKALRASRWAASFSAKDQSDGSFKNRRSTIVLELIIQASDVSHTMQHFTVYKKWNMNLLAEMYAAFKSGRTSKDPLDGWYDGELWFFDNYIIPLAQKLRECGVFGVSCDEFLDYAKDNRAEWEMKGRAIVEEAKSSLESAAMGKA